MPTDPPRHSQNPNARPTRRRASGGGRPPEHPPASHRRMRIADVRRVRRQVLFSLYAILAGEVVAVALTTPLLHIRRIQVQGTSNLTPAETRAVTTAATLPSGTNFLIAPMGRVQTHLHTMPWVRSVTLRRRFPDTVRVEVTAREPVAQVVTPGGSVEVDAAGIPIRTVRPEMISRLPLIAWMQPGAVTLGKEFGDYALQTALALALWAQKDGNLHLAKIEVDQSDNLCLNMRDGIAIKLGQDADMETKRTLVSALYRRDPDIARRIEKIDLSCPTDVACTPRVVVPTPLSSGPNSGSTVVSKP